MTRPETSRKLILAGAALAAATAVLGFAARPAHACGGLFCSGPPPDPFAPLPVAQSGENIIFAVDKDAATGQGTVTAYIQILYQGTATDFSWVLPIDAIPTITVGTDRAFARVAQLTQPSYRVDYVTEGTRPDPERHHRCGRQRHRHGRHGRLGEPAARHRHLPRRRRALRRPRGQGDRQLAAPAISG